MKCKTTPNRWGGLRAADSLLRKWATERLTYKVMAERLTSKHQIPATAAGVRAYCLREGFNNHKATLQKS